jgi:hypothetical protein
MRGRGEWEWRSGRFDRLEFVQAAKQVQQAGFAEGVVDLGPTSVVLDDADMAQDGEVGRDGGHGEPDERGEFSDALFATTEGIDDDKAVWVAEGLEDICGGAEIGWSWGRWEGRGGLLHYFDTFKSLEMWQAMLRLAGFKAGESRRRGR